MTKHVCQGNNYDDDFIACFEVGMISLQSAKN